ncbi:ParB/RepB/Spo0J family partition protein [Cellulosilyticum sp. WCF-2]|uniref:ParB/RepB/Spo0J family partition protein n=1 Tax=Cellulosilyticum sp. WCF-2 TaxID=2497860 RepID=UPI000F8D5007|nr:ParB/RepB/Spo0J family partition protein [Cellulosilyticum sp. WCF-2]QEH70612.1 ParB/RepB/Spo0J family partition protein [Cellulosilyticum sp. WCF-2]
MAGRAGQKIKLTSIDELLCVPETEGTIDLDVRAIYPFENHPFKVIDDEKMDELVESIKTNGLLTPVLVRPDDEGTYEMISGHRRLHAAKRAGLFRIPAIVKEMTNDEATIAMVDANVQREEILASERAFSLKMKMDAMNHRGKRTDLTLSHEETKFHTAEKIGEAEGLGRAQVHRYIRLTELIPKLLDMVDEKRLALSVAVELSYMNKNVQQWIYEFIRENGMIKQEQLMELRKYRDDKNMTQEQLITILIGSASTVPVSKKITLNERKLHKFFPAYYSKAEMERVIFGLLEQWKQAQDSEEN